MRLSALLIRLAVIGVAAFLATVAARFAVAAVEDLSVAAVEAELESRELVWVSVLGDGLQVILEGEAPDEATRFRAMSTAGKAVDAARVIDNMSVAETEAMLAPSFAIEILRGDSGVSLIGLIPAETDREALNERISAIADGQPVTDLLEVADYPRPDTWRPALNYALRALDLLERSKISVTAQRVTVEAISDSAAEKRRMETELARNTPDGVALAVAITAPRPVVSPYVMRFVMDDEGTRFLACTVDNEDAKAVVVEAATEVGFAGKATCTQALGAPSRQWGEAVAMSIRALRDLGGGTLTVSDTDVSLVAIAGTSQNTFDTVVGELENALPAVFALQADLPTVNQGEDDGIPQFIATRSPEGLVQLRGRVADALTNSTAETYAQARFGKGRVTMGTRISDGLPTDWAVRVLAGIEALSELSNGAVVVEPETITVRGNTGNEGASTAIIGLLVDKLGENADVSVDVNYMEALDPIAGLPTPDECIAQIGIVTDARKITFDPGSATISLDTLPVIDDIAEILLRCPDLPMQIAGYTDSQGREVMNQQLSQDRATAVLTALRQRRIPTSSFKAIGFGEENPIADNGTEEGREANRRIEFSLIVPEAIEETETTLEAVEAAAPEGEAPAEAAATEEDDSQ